MPRCEVGQRTPDEEPQPAAAQAVRRISARKALAEVVREVTASKEHDPAGGRAARAVLVFGGAGAAVPVLPPDPLQMLDLQSEQGENPQEDRGPRHPRTVAQERAARNGPPDSFLRRLGPTTVRRCGGGRR